MARNKRQPAQGLPQGAAGKRRIHVNKLPIILPAAAAALVLGIYTALNLAPAAGAEQQVSLGQRHLEEMDYNSALLSFSQAIQVDPANTQAQLGLAQAYMGLGDYKAAQNVVADMGSAAETPEALKVKLDIALQEGDAGQAIEQVWNLIQATDEDEYYTQLEELLAEYTGQPHSVDLGEEHQAYVRDGVVYTQGRNTMGQLGVSQGLGQGGEAAEDFVDAQFPGQAAKVYCIGQTTFVIDEDGALWAAGENRWGQKGTGVQDLSLSAGWRQVANGGNAASVAGAKGYTVVLKRDGTLWTMGYRNQDELTQAVGLPPIREICCADAGSAYALSVNGELYGGLYGAWNAGVTNELVDWVRVATRVSRFYLDEFASPVWLDQQDMLHTPDAHVPAFLPEEWMSAPADISVARMTGPYEAVLLSTEEGELLAASYYGSGSLEPVGEGGDVAAMYTIGESRSYAVIEYKDGSAQVWDPAAGRLWELEDFLQDKEHIPY